MSDTSPQRYDFVCFTGDDFSRTLLIKDADTNEPEDLTGRSYEMKVYESYKDRFSGAQPIISSADIDFDIESAEGTLGLSINRTVTNINIDEGSNPFTEKECYYDIVETNSGEKSTILYGLFTFRQRLT